MTENQILVIAWLIGFAGRIPRIVERWTSPFLGGPGWFFGVQVAPDFLAVGGRAILARYRLRLFLPWAIEIPVTVALLATGHKLAILLLISVITLLTRLNYYADRQAAVNQARRFEAASANNPVFTVALSLEPRMLGSYTNRWIETTIVLAVCGSLAWLIYRYTILGDWHRLHGPLAATLVSIYLQIGMLLAKRAFVRARTVAPADTAEQYLAWRESLRRLSTALCDYLRLSVVCLPLLVDLASVTNPWQGSVQQTGSIAFVFVLSVVAACYEWRTRLRHLKVARATRPAEFLVRPDTTEAARLVCFRPSLPMLLLKGPGGYALNLGSAPAKTAGLYLAGYALLLVCLTR
ncbi:MAG TPA: hypothetical protein VGZ73_04730 [Bryobacteraceae bacterium]|nr:hypothetical protein [Bryobacteraceae bacterium]